MLRRRALIAAASSVAVFVLGGVLLRGASDLRPLPPDADPVFVEALRLTFVVLGCLIGAFHAWRYLSVARAAATGELALTHRRRVRTMRRTAVWSTLVLALFIGGFAWRLPAGLQLAVLCLVLALAWAIAATAVVRADQNNAEIRPLQGSPGGIRGRPGGYWRHGWIAARPSSRPRRRGPAPRRSTGRGSAQTDPATHRSEQASGDRDLSVAAAADTSSRVPTKPTRTTHNRTGTIGSAPDRTRVSASIPTSRSSAARGGGRRALALSRAGEPDLVDPVEQRPGECVPAVGKGRSGSPRRGRRRGRGAAPATSRRSGPRTLSRQACE